MGFLSDIFGGATKDAARANMGAINKFDKQGQAYIDAGSAEAKDYLGQAGDIYGDMSQMGLDNLGFYKDALGLSGADGSAAARERFQAGPGYDFQMSQGLDALERRAGARGQLNSGNTNIDTLRFASGLADSEWDDYLANLQGFDSANRNMYMAGAQGQAGSLGSLADLAGQTTDRQLGLGSAVLGARTSANNQLAEGRNQGVGAFGSILSGGLKFLGGYA